MGRRGTIGLGQFWSSRARRLLPALLLAAFVVVIGSHLFAAPGTLATLRGDLVGTLTYTANWRFVAQGTSYWTDLGPPSPLQHVWSLAIEEQFYLLWPVAVIGLLRWRRSPRLIVVVAILLAVASTIAMAFTAFPGDSSRAYFGTDTHAAPILLGAALAALFATRGTLRGRGMRRLLDVAAVLALAGVVSVWLLLDGRTSFLYHGGFLGFAVLCAIVIAALSHPDPGPLGRGFSWRPLAWVGLISYGLYLFHWPVYLWLTPQSTGLGDGLGLVGVRLALDLRAGDRVVLRVGATGPAAPDLAADAPRRDPGVRHRVGRAARRGHERGAHHERDARHGPRSGPAADRRPVDEPVDEPADDPGDGSR